MRQIQHCSKQRNPRRLLSMTYLGQTLTNSSALAMEYFIPKKWVQQLTFEEPNPAINLFNSHRINFHTQHIEAWMNWSTNCRHFQMHFLEWSYLKKYSNFIKIYSLRVQLTKLHWFIYWLFAELATNLNWTNDTSDPFHMVLLGHNESMASISCTCI